MKNAFYILLFNLLSISSYGQWSRSLIDTNMYHIKDLHFINADTGLIIGMLDNASGFISKTEDGGNSWTYLWRTNSNSFPRLDKISAVNDSTLFVIGRDGFIFKTFDQGNTWIQDHAYFTNADAIGIFAVNNITTLIRYPDGSIYRSIDSLQNWNFATTINSKNYHFYHPTQSFTFVTDSVGFVFGNGIKKTYDEGATWHSTNSDTNNFYNAIFMLNENAGFAVGDNGYLLKTIDGGENWTTSKIANQNLLDIAFINESIGFCVGGGTGLWSDTTGILLTTFDGGNTWTTADYYGTRLHAIQIIDSVGYIVGSKGQLFKISDVRILSTPNVSSINTELTIWPNPTKNAINFNLPDEPKMWTIKIYSAKGKELIESTVTSNQSISLNSFPKGIYFIQLSSDNEVRLGKIIKQ